MRTQQLPSKQQRLAWYKLTLDLYMSGKNDYCVGVCFVLYKVSDSFHKLLSSGEHSKYLLPELYEVRTTDEGNAYWFNGREERIEALMSVIRLMESQQVEGLLPWLTRIVNLFKRK